MHRKEVLCWFKLFGKLPLGTWARFNDKRFKKGWVEGRIFSYMYYLRGDDDDPRNFTYCIETKGKILNKNPLSLREVLT